MTDILKAFGNKTRVRIMKCLADGEKRVSYLVNECRLSQSAVSQHLQKLVDAGLVEKRKEKRNVYCTLSSGEYGEIADQLISISKEE